MPIKSIKGRDLILHQGLPIIGKLRKGESQEDAQERARKAGKRGAMPQELNYFRLAVNDAPASLYTASQIESAFEALYGAQPKSISGVKFLTDNVDEAFKTQYARFGKRSDGTPVLTRVCDGEHIQYRNEGANGIDRTKSHCICDWDSKDAAALKANCQPSGELFFWLPELTKTTGVLGLFKLETHSTNDIVNITSTLNMIAQSTGNLRQWSFTLYRQAKNVTSPDGLTITKHLVYLGFEQAAAQQFAALAAQDALSLTSGNGNGHTTPAPLALNAGTNEAPEVAYRDSTEAFYEMCIVEAKDGRRMYWFKSLEESQFKTTDTALVEGAIPLAGMPIGEWFEIELGGRVDGDKVIELWAEVE